MPNPALGWPHRLRLQITLKTQAPSQLHHYAKPLWPQHQTGPYTLHLQVYPSAPKLEASFLSSKKGSWTQKFFSDKLVVQPATIAKDF